MNIYIESMPHIEYDIIELTKHVVCDMYVYSNFTHSFLQFDVGRMTRIVKHTLWR